MLQWTIYFVSRCLDREESLRNVNYRTEAANMSQSSKEFLLIKVKEDALKKSLIFLEQQDSIDFKTKDLTAARRLINQITLQRMSLL
jgi:hypothetical protein